MSLLEKIKSLLWFNHNNEVKQVLLEMYQESSNKIEEAPKNSNKYVRQNGTWSELQDISEIRNEQGQVKINYIGLSTTGFIAEVIKVLDINSATPIVVSSPTTTYPFSTPNNYGGFFDSSRGSSPTGRLIENPINGQVHTWRFQISYVNKAAGNNGSLDLILTNPVSGFQYVMPFTLPSGRTSGTLNNVAITIADGASIPIPNGYILQCRTSFSDANLTIDSISITRISQAKENI